ncbi:TPA: UDP-glucose 4-epimerase GalE [Candidatus Sumerlaeota bacterium]|jgi:UDP-glucose 4-epimerase|nr:UDP-glucose 4-epimerase GalE [Candidatus Sumerlaeota bacterium]
MSILVAGGAGYIGSVTVERLSRAGHKVVVYDNLSRGHREAVPNQVTFVQGDIADSATLEKALREHKVDAVMHFCAHSQVGESVKEPFMYYQNNVQNGINLLGAMLRCDVKQFIFSSTAAVFGEPDAIPITEETAQHPTNPYGRTKWMFEQILRDCSDAHGLRSISLRYFNACGATELCGEDHTPETHLIPIVLDVAAGKRESLGIFGRDYPTQDGTCIRDYVHVSDLADAHIKALEALGKGAATNIYNLGNGQGFSVLEVVQAAEEVTSRKIPCINSPRRAGDPARLVASSDRIREELHWNPQIADLRRIIETAWKWKLEHPNGYGSAPAAAKDRFAS